LDGWQDDHAEKDIEESQSGSGQDAPASRRPLELELLRRRPQWHGKGKAPICLKAIHIQIKSRDQHNNFNLSSGVT
jgi:hypothetical protein